MRTYQLLSDHDFELLIADLLGAEDQVRYEVFARGADGGVDLRHVDGGAQDVIQCKHMANSTWAQLKSAAKDEAVKLARLTPAPERYRFVTTQALTPARKKELKAILTPWIAAEDDILGADDLEGLLNDNERVERAHLKLWLGSAAQLDAALHSATWEASRQLRDEITLSLPRYVENRTFPEARTRLRRERVLVISGPPGIGKTTLARMLLAEATMDDYEPIAVSSDIAEAAAVINDHHKRVFYYDDFLGSTFLEDRLAKNEDKRLTSFIRRCARSSNNLLILTTREHILQQAGALYEDIDAVGLPLRRFLLELSDYDRLDRARIFYNHIWHSDQITAPMRRALMNNKAYLRIIDHPNYNPRLIEYITGWAAPLDADVERDYVPFALDILDHPDRIWLRAFEHQLDDDCKALLIAVASCNTPIVLADAQAAFQALQAARGEPATHLRFRDALRVLDDSFLKSYEASDETFLEVTNPSVLDFVADWLRDSQDYATKLLEGTAFFEQLLWLEQENFSFALDAEVFTARLEALYLAEPIQWREFLDLDVNRFELSRERRDLESRLVFTYQLGERYDSDPLRDLFTTWLTQRAARWDRRAHPGQITALIRALHASAHPVPRAVTEAARDALKAMNYEYGWSQLGELRTIAPEVFPTHVQREIRTECSRWFQEQLDDPEDIRDTDSLDEMRRVAQNLGATIDDDAYEAVWDQVNARGADQGEPDPATTPWLRNPVSTTGSQAEIDAMFSHLDSQA